MKTRISISYIFLLFVTCYSVMSQGPTITDMSTSQIDRLQEGTLLIKLNTQSERIEHRRSTGQVKKAQKLAEEVEQEHRKIIAAFKEHYTFSDYYFFLSDDSNEVILKKNYNPLFKVKEQNMSSLDIKNPFVLILGVPPGYSTVDKYKFILHELGDNGLSPIEKPMPKVFKTQTKKLFSNRYDFDRGVKILEKRLSEYQEKNQSLK